MINKEQQAQINAIMPQVDIVVEENFKRHLCALLYTNSSRAVGLGTGNLLQHGGKVYILTCWHVAEQALQSRYFTAQFLNRSQINGDQISLFQRAEDQDLALLEIAEGSLALTGLAPLTLERLIGSTDLREFSKKRLIFVFVGFPSDIMKADFQKMRIGLRLDIYYTVASRKKHNSKNEMYLEYPYGKGIVKDLPQAYGFSGSGIW